MDITKLVKAISKETLEAGKMARKYFGKVKPTYKKDRSYLTEADLRIEEHFRKKLPGIIGDAAFIGEEYGMDDSKCPAATGCEWAWVVDPIDGTASFVDCLPNYCISVGLARNGKPFAGVILFPETNYLYEAAKGYGAFLNGEPIKVSKAKAGINDVMYSYSKWHLRYNITFPGKVRNLGTTAGHIALVARGAGAASLGNGRVWDYMAGAAILMQAGGTLKHTDGSIVNWKQAIENPGDKMKHILSAPSGRWKDAAFYIKAHT